MTKLIEEAQCDECEGLAKAKWKIRTHPSLPEPFFEGTQQTRVRGYE